MTRADLTKQVTKPMGMSTFGPLPSPSRLIITDSCAWHRQIQGLIAGRIRPAMM